VVQKIEIARQPSVLPAARFAVDRLIGVASNLGGSCKPNVLAVPARRFSLSKSVPLACISLRSFATSGGGGDEDDFGTNPK
jgi:hypothetical protein